MGGEDDRKNRMGKAGRAIEGLSGAAARTGKGKKKQKYENYYKKGVGRVQKLRLINREQNSQDYRYIENNRTFGVDGSGM